MTENPFDKPLDRTAALLAGEPPEITHLKKMHAAAVAEWNEITRQIKALEFAINQHDIFCRPERE